MIRKVCFFGPKKIRFMQTESVLQTKNRSEPAKNRFSVALRVSIELPVATRHLRDMTEKLLKVTLNLNKQQQQHIQI